MKLTAAIPLLAAFGLACGATPKPSPTPILFDAPGPDLTRREAGPEQIGTRPSARPINRGGERAVAWDAKNPEVVALKAKARTLMKGGDFTGAATLYERGFSESRHPGFLYARAIALSNVPGFCGQARDAFRRFLDACEGVLCPFVPAARDRYALIRAKCPTGDADLGLSEGELLKKVEATGWADVRPGRRAEAKQKALKDALRHAVELVVGVYIESRSTDRVWSRVRNDKTLFEQRVSDEILTRSEGFIESYKIVGEHEQGGVVEVLVSATVKRSALQRDLERLSRGLAELRFPTVALYVEAQWGDKDYDPTHMARELEDALMGWGFDLVGTEQLAKLQQGDLKTLQAAERVNKATEVAIEAGAEYLFYARVTFSESGLDPLGTGRPHLEAKYSIRMIEASTAEVVGSLALDNRANGPTKSVVEARLLTTLREKLVPGAVKRVLRHFDDPRGVRYVVQLTFPGAWASEGLTFQTVLKRIHGVRDVVRRSLGGGRAEFQLRYPSSLQPSHLEEEILVTAQKQRVLKGRLDVKAARGRRLLFSLARGNTP